MHVLCNSALPRGQIGWLAAQLWKRNLTIRDDSGSSVEITFWGQYAQDPGDMLQEVCSCPYFHAPVSAPLASTCILQEVYSAAFLLLQHFLQPLLGTACSCCGHATQLECRWAQPWCSSIGWSSDRQLLLCRLSTPGSIPFWG